MPRKRVLEALEANDRATQRRRLGTLRDLTVQPATKRRYTLATQAFYSFLKDEGLELPTSKPKLDELVCDYLEHLWSTGAGRGQANDTVAGLQDLQPNLRHHLPGSWRLLKTWAVNEVPCRAPPLPDHVVKAMAGWAFFKGHFSFGVSLLVGFYTMLRTGEIVALKTGDILATPQDRQVLISLGMTKGGKRHGAAESVVLGYQPAVSLVKAWKAHQGQRVFLTSSPSSWRALFNECISALGIEAHQFRPYSLRRGGATFWFQKHQSFDRILVQGRWHTQRSARIYLNEGLAMLASMALPPHDPKLKHFIHYFSVFSQNPTFQKLEPPAKGGRAGASGKAPKARAKRGKGVKCRPFFGQF
eukprot:Skav233495  [mRNA]  locus=scaffold5081:59211:60287:+ [translate_table: standard]